MASGTIFNIQKFCINDGPGIRTTVFVKGCPLNCLWCHNPESKSRKREIFFDIRKCIYCRACEAACTMGCHEIGENHAYHRDACKACGVCTQACVTGALESVGYEISVEDALKEVMKDEIFYQTSGGGMTISGGEPMYQFDFAFELVKAAKEKGLHVCMETCGFAPAEHYRQIAPYVDIFLLDFKISDSVEHEHYTGVPNDLIHSNIRMLDEMGASIVLRCPIIPGINDTSDHFRGIAEMANSLKHIQGIDLEPYHPLGSGKSDMLGKEYKLADLGFPEKETVDGWIAEIQKQTQIVVKKA